MRIAALLLVAALLAGCSSSPEADPEDADGTGDDLPADNGSGDGGDTPTPGATPPAPPAVLINAPPTVELTATAYEGAAPLDVTFLVDASDEDGDALTYNLGFGDGSANATGGVADDGSASVNHTFAAEGTYTVVVAVFDGTAVAAANVTLVVGTASPTAAPETFYLHAAGSGPGTLDHIAASEEEAGHGGVPLGTALVDWYQQSFAATEPTLYAHATGNQVLVHIQGFTLTPDPTVKANVVLKAGDTQVGSGSSPTATSMSIGLVTTPCVDLVVPITLTGDVPAGATLTMDVTVDSASVFAPCFPGGENGPRAIFA